MTRKRLLKSFKIVAINLLLLMLLFEAASLALYFHHTGRFFYSQNGVETKIISLISDVDARDEAGSTSLKRTLDPYLGFVYDPHARNKLQFSNIEYAPNNFGLLSPYDYPYRKKSDKEFIVGIFGGSVAMYYGFYELENHALVNTLKQLPYFQDKEIVVLPFAGGSYKQPQQLLELNYFTALGQDFDLVINIEGFNETALAYLNTRAGYDPSMPSAEMFQPLVQLANRSFSSRQLALTLEILKLKDDLRATQASLNNCRFASCYGLTWIKLRFLVRQYQKKTEDFNRLITVGNEDSLVHVNERPQSSDDATVFEDIAAVWMKSELAMNQLLTARRISYFQVIQPNQYYATARNFSEPEQATLNSSSRYAEGVVKGYPKLIAQLDDLKRSGIRVINAVSVFDQTTEPVYADSCCHYNRAGNELFAKFVAGQIAKSLESESFVR
ncbi:MAG TPA: hypothetical protein VE863_20455 [Pyrinomonadaceae bacterium]|nr:hypothetical protein [Pyrinomonadaceae bacterium]